jgi:hypothetical protein
VRGIQICVDNGASSDGSMQLASTWLHRRPTGCYYYRLPPPTTYLLSATGCALPCCAFCPSGLCLCARNGRSPLALYMPETRHAANWHTPGCDVSRSSQRPGPALSPRQDTCSCSLTSHLSLH